MLGHSSFKSTAFFLSNRDEKAAAESDDEWEWTDDDEEEQENQENVDPKAHLTAEKLEKVKDIIAKPEDRWRILWQETRHCESPSSVASSSSKASNASRCGSNLVQPSVDDPLSLVKVASAKQWKAISQKLSINLDGIDLGEEEAQMKESRPTTPSDFKPSTVQQLRLICWRIKPWDQPKVRHLFTSMLAAGWRVDCDEVFPKLFIGMVQF